MGNSALIFAFLLLVSVASASFFQRPWESQSWIAKNPNIWSYGIEYWWNLPELDKTISSIENEPITGLSMNGSAAKYSAQSAEARLESRQDKDHCIYAVTAAIGGFPAAPITLFISAFAEGIGCISYHADWTNAVGSSLSTLESSMAESDKAIDAARNAYDRIVFMGICGSDYTGPGTEDCAELSSAFASIDNNITEGRYGKYHIMLGHASIIRQELAMPVPDLSLYGTMMKLVWDEDGVIDLFGSAAAMAKKAESDAETEFKSRLASAQSHKATAEKTISGLEAEDLALIESMPAGFEVRKTGSVKEKLAGLEKESASLNQALAEAVLWHGRTTRQGYLAAALEGVEEADEGYSGLILEASDLRTEAETAVEQQKEEAERELEDTRRFSQSGEAGPDMQELLSEAEGYFSDGEAASTLGSAFALYSRAAALARSARESNYAEELGSVSALAELEDLIARAEKDGINVLEEKEALALMEQLPPFQTEEHTGQAIATIISKARVMYEDGFLSARARIYDELSLAGPDAADLSTDMARCEEGLVSDSGIEMPKAIGSLKVLAAAYAKIESSLDQYSSQTVGNAMSASARPLITDVRLDEPAEVILDVVLANDRPYNASNVEVRVSIPAPLPFLYSDITSGKEGVSSLRMENGDTTLVFVFPIIKPFDSKRIILEKNMVLARTVERSSSAEGIGDGSALVKEEITFELDSGIDSLVLPHGMEEATVDGLPSQRPLAEGKHTLLSERTEYDAYSESIANVRSYPLGPSARIEYDIRITPNMDLTSVPMLIDSLNDSRISAFTLSSVTGEPVKDSERVSETQLVCRVFSLKEGKTAVLKIGYTVEDTGPFVYQQIDQLEGGNMSTGALELLEQARSQADSGNYSKALELLEKSRAVIKQDSQETAKLAARCDDMVARITTELEDIDKTLQSSNVSTPFMEKVLARKTELERVLADSEGLNLTEKSEALGNVDYNWLGKELNSFRKQAYTEYNDLKARFFAAGNSTTPEAFLEFEAALHRLDSGARLEYAGEVSDALSEVRRLVEAEEKLAESGKSDLRRVFDSAESDLNEVLGRYSKQAAAAKGTDYSGLFTESETKTSKLLADTKSALSGDPRVVLANLQNLNRSMARMELILGSLKNESETKLLLLEHLLEASKLDAAKKAEFAQKLEGMRGMISSGEYVNALRAGSTIAKDMEGGGQGDDSGLAVLGLSAVAILAGITFFIMRQEPKKELRKLPSSKELFRPAQEKPSEGPKEPGPEPQV
ncbi:hypothetical protein H0O00_00660 [Candidatus Micrarchaeota archaeon]|nr:hypothetical protein [Candidatus Micrarchaeota archaeon]